MRTEKVWLRHMAMAMACACWEPMAPFTKDAMRVDFTGLDVVSFRVVGGAVLFGLTSFVLSLCGKKQDHVPLRDVGLFYMINSCPYSDKSSFKRG